MVEKLNKVRIFTLLCVLTLVIVASFVLKQTSTADDASQSIRSRKPRVFKDLHQRYPEIDFEFKPYEGELNIQQDLESANMNLADMTVLDGMSKKDIAVFRIKKIDRYRKLGIFHQRYHPLLFYHQRIYGPITSGQRWLGPVPYYIANPYLLIILTCANHVTPINLYCPDVQITYKTGMFEEVRTGNSAACWFHAVYNSYDFPGKVWPVMVNAWDAGFFYCHVDVSRSVNVEKETSYGHITNSLHTRRYLFHVGKYKKNNLSPTTRQAWLTLAKPNSYTLIYIKLWRKPPKGPIVDPDLVYLFRIIPDLKS